MKQYGFLSCNIANTDSSHEITKSMEQCTKLINAGTNECNAQRKVFDLADIMMGRKTVSSLLP